MKRLTVTLVALAFALLPALSFATFTQETRPMSDTAPPVIAPVVDPTAAPVVAPAPAAVPEWLKEVPVEMQESFRQYATPADALKAHQELRTKLGSKAKPADDGLSITPDPVAAAPVTDADLQAFISSAGLNTTDIQKAWTESGELSADHYKALAGKGLGRKAVDTFLAMETKLRDYTVKEVRGEAAKIVGGEQQLSSLLQWGKQDDAITPAEREWYNAQASNPASAARAVEWLNGKYQAAVGAGRANPLIEGGGAAVPSGGAYTSRAEFLADRSNPEYKPGTAHFAKVQARIKNTPSLANLA